MARPTQIVTHMVLSAPPYVAPAAACQIAAQDRQATEQHRAHRLCVGHMQRFGDEAAKGDQQPGGDEHAPHQRPGGIARRRHAVQAVERLPTLLAPITILSVGVATGDADLVVVGPVETAECHKLGLYVTRNHAGQAGGGNTGDRLPVCCWPCNRFLAAWRRRPAGSPSVAGRQVAISSLGPREHPFAPHDGRDQCCASQDDEAGRFGVLDEQARG
jgi:hypothetical protein